MIIDFHTHVLSPRIKSNRSRYVDIDPAFALIYSDEKARIATAEELIDSMDRDGVDISVIVNYGWTTHELCVETNDYILESVARYPKRLIGFCAVQSCAGESAVAEIERCARGGIKGVGELRPDMLYPFITNFPDLTTVCAHWGGGLPFYILMPEVREALKNVYFDTAASPFLYSPRVYNQVSQLVGADRILFGSDYPLLPQSRLLREINSTDLPEEARSLILSGNAGRLLGIET